MATFPIAHLRDDFENNTIDSCWTKTTSGSATGSETGGQAVFTLPSSTAGTHDAHYTSNATYDLTGDQASIQIGTMVTTGVAAMAYFQLIVDTSNYYQWIQQSNTLKAQKIVAGVTTDLFSATWSSTNHKYLRVRESGGTVFFDSSSNGTSWTNRASVAVSGNVAVTALTVQFGAQCGNVASPGSFKLDMFNMILPTPTSTWRTNDADWQITNRHMPYSLASTGNAQGVIAVATAKDTSGNLSGTVRYFAGPVGSSSGGYAQLTEYSTLAAAQNNPFTIPTDGRVYLPSLVDGRIHRLYMRSANGSSYTIREWMPRRLIQTDDLQVENIDAIVVKAGTITVDKLYATLTITGKKIQTADSGARAVMSGDTYGGFIGYGATDTYDPTTGTGTYQLLWNKNDGKLYASDGSVIIDDSAITIITGSAYTDALAVKWTDGTNIFARMQASWVASNYHEWRVILDKITGRLSKAVIDVDSPTAVGTSDIFLNARVNGVLGAQITVKANNAGASQIYMDYAPVFVTQGLNVGTATGAGVGEIKSSARVFPGNTICGFNTNLNGSIANNGVAALSTTANFFGFAFIWGGGAAAIFAINGTNNTATEMSDPSAIFSATAGTASSINVYWSAANSRYEIENKRGSTIATRIWLMES